MGNNFSTANQSANPSANNEQHSDFNPEQNVHGSGPDQKFFLNSHVNSSEFSGKKMSIDNVISGPINTIFHCSGHLSEKLTSFSNLRLTFIEFSGGESLLFNETGVKFFNKKESFLLKNFEMLLNGSMSEGDFKEDLVRDNPEKYAEIWSVLTSGNNFQVRYSYNSLNPSIKPEDYQTRFDLFKNQSYLLRVRRNPFSGELIAHVAGQVRPEISFKGANWSLDRVSFLNETNPTERIDFSILKSCFVLQMDGKSYNLPNYVEVLRGTITQIDFKNRLRRDILHDFDRVWSFLVERKKPHLAYYSRKLEW